MHAGSPGLVRALLERAQHEHSLAAQEAVLLAVFIEKVRRRTLGQ